MNAARNAPPDFSRLARLYRWLEYLSFGPFLWRCRTHFLPQITNCRHALILGDGDGRFTARLLRINLQIRVTAVDASPRMIASLQNAALPHRNRLTTEVADLRIWSPATAEQAEQYDLIVTHFFLDCLSTGEIAALARRLTPFLAPSALWLISEFAIPQSRFGRAIASPLISFLYRSFRLLTNLRQQALPEHHRALGASGWILHDDQSHLKGLLVSELWGSSPGGESHPLFDPSIH
ncbi:class I SAM-dependent methyltransferase [Acidicapsa acidisoli]|uniref:class I SAM-dependent methyltransferase n=1 Tax=Acidicapsa acidisoli TaxID=1615681 RepID=UPI0021E0F199|nr:class I SAM-dependent methyltransferase [Acidicapsa acidisoli]